MGRGSTSPFQVSSTASLAIGGIESFDFSKFWVSERERGGVSIDLMKSCIYCQFSQWASNTRPSPENIPYNMFKICTGEFYVLDWSQDQLSGCLMSDCGIF